MNENRVLYFTVMPSHGDVMHSLLPLVGLLQLATKCQKFIHTSRSPLRDMPFAAHTYVLAMHMALCRKSRHKFDVSLLMLALEGNSSQTT